MTAQTHMKMKNNDIWKRDNCYEIKDIFNSLRKLHLSVGDFQISREFRCIRCVHLKSFSYWIRLWSPITSWHTWLLGLQKWTWRVHSQSWWRNSCCWNWASKYLFLTFWQTCKGDKGFNLWVIQRMDLGKRLFLKFCQTQGMKKVIFQYSTLLQKNILLDNF